MADTSPLFYGIAMGQNQTGTGSGGSYAQMLQQLSMIQKYDPSAKLVDTGSQLAGSEGSGMGQLNPDGTMNYDAFTIDYDRSKLPAPGQSGLSGNLVNFDPTDKTFGSTSAYGGHEWLSDPSKVYNDPNYGWLTPSSNYHTEYTGTASDRTNDMIGKAILAASMGVMGGGVASALGGGAGGALGSGAFKFGIGELLSGGKMNPLQALMSMAGGQIPGGNILMSLYQLIQGMGQNHG